MRKKNTNEQLHTQPQFRLKPVYAAVLLAVAVQTAQGNPMGGTVAAGQASFATTGNTLNVTNTPGTIINWQGFSIGANEITHFAQQSASSSVLNRVISNNPSSILGTLQSNGRVFLINPGGIVFGVGATVDVAGMVASTLNLSNADFLAGRNHFTQVPGSANVSSANVSNAGNITAQNGGQIYLIAPNVENTGVITAPNGEILLAAGYSVDLVSTSDPDLRVNITAPAGDATNVGQLIAQSGSLGLFGTVVRNSGTVSADSATMQGGKIVFKASQSAEISGTVSATGVQGGDIQILGKQVALINSANVDASGINGGGTVLVGGDAHGANAAVQNAQQTFVDATATIKADALQNGNGGKAVVWADNATQFSGNISARGGAVSGNGGWVEVSGKQWMGYTGLVNTTAAHGLTGSLLLDPTDITIGVAPDTTTMTCTIAGVCTDVATTPSNLNITKLVTQLGSSNVTVDTTSALGGGVGNITIADSLVYSSPNTLTLNAAGTGFIQVNANNSILTALTPLSISVSGGGSLVMQTAGGSIGIGALGGITITGGGSFTANAGGATSDVIINSAINTGAGAINLTAGHDIRITSVAGSLTPYPAPAYIQAANGIDLTMQTGGLYIDGTASSPAYVQTTSGNINVATSTGFANGSLSGYGNTGALSAPLGRWLVWAPDPSTVVYGGLVYDFKQYNTAFGGSVLGTGNGFIYTIAPTVAFGLTSAVSKIYDGTNTASLVAGNFLAPVGAIDGDTVNAPVSATGSYDTQNVGTGKIVTASGSTAASNGGAAVYGYHYSASGAVGTITPASFTILVPPVIDEIVDISNQNHKKPEDVLAGDIPTGEGGNTSTLPVCN